MKLALPPTAPRLATAAPMGPAPDCVLKGGRTLQHWRIEIESRYVKAVTFKFVAVTVVEERARKTVSGKSWSEARLVMLVRKEACLVVIELPVRLSSR